MNNWYFFGSKGKFGKTFFIILERGSYEKINFLSLGRGKLLTKDFFLTWRRVFRKNRFFSDLEGGLLNKGIFSIFISLSEILPFESEKISIVPNTAVPIRKKSIFYKYPVSIRRKLGLLKFPCHIQKKIIYFSKYSYSNQKKYPFFF